MTITARIVTAIVTLPILGTVRRDDRGEVVKNAEKYRIHIYAAIPGWKEGKEERNFLTVGVLTGGGYTSTPSKRSVDVILPEGRELVALVVDENGLAKSWESLPIHVDGWTLGSPFMVSDGQVFIDSAFIQSGNNGTYKINVGVKSNSIKEKVHTIVSKYLTGEATEHLDEMVDELMQALTNSTEVNSDTLELSKAIAAYVDLRFEDLKARQIRPGGELWNLLKGR